MYTDFKDYLTYELYPALFERLGEEGALDEFQFKPAGKGYRSTTVRKHTGRDGKSKGQVYVYANNPSYLIDVTEAKSSQDIFEYVRYIRSGQDIGFSETINQLANMAGIKPFRRELTEEQLEAIHKANRSAAIWEAAINYCIHCRGDVQYKDAPDAKRVVNYLTVSRKYTREDIGAMGLGYLPGKNQLFEHLIKEKYSEAEIRETINFSDFAGVTHKLTIPIRNAYGKAVGMALRNVDYVEGSTKGPKYLYNTGLKKTEALNNLYTKARNKRVVLVEGQLDAAITDARGYTWASVAAIGGKVINRKQIEHLINAGTKEVFICLDNEEGTTENIKETVKALADVEQLDGRIYIVQLPKGIKDVDELITKEGIEAFGDAVRQAPAYYTHYADKRIVEFNKQIEEEGRTDKNTNDLVDDIEAIAATISNPTRRDDLKNIFTRGLREAGIDVTAEAFKDAVERVRYKSDQAKQDEELKKLLKKADDLRTSGNVKGAVDEITNKIREVKLRSKRAEFEQLESEEESEEAIMRRIQEAPDAVRSGYKIKIDGHEEHLELAPGQLTFFAAPTGHGKTLILTNTALNVIREYPNKEIYFFTFEMSADQIRLHFLNTYAELDLNEGHNNNRRTIRDFFKGNDQFIADKKKQIFAGKRAAFFAKVLPRLKVRNVEYSADEIIEYIEYITKRTKDAVIFIDYIQKLRSDRKGNIEGRYNELKFICEDLNACAMRTGLPIVLAAQFKREIATPLDMHPTGIAEASDIEKIASEIYGLWNCTKKLGRKVTDTEIKIINSQYGISAKEFAPEPFIILEVLKSRSLATGAHVKLSYNANTGVIAHEHVGGLPKQLQTNTRYED